MSSEDLFDHAAEAEPGEFSFEEALARLEQIVEALEGGQLTLEEALALFEEGTRLQRICQRKLQQAEVRIEQVLAEAAAETEETDAEAGPE
jgi:exodeoxyribonuclease VII small subunit